MEQQTGYSAPPSEFDASILNSSGSSSATAKAAPMKRMRPTPAAPALVATFANVDAHNAGQVNVSSGSEILSVTSSTERLRRAQLARAQLELAEARVKVAQAELDLASGSQAGSVGRLTDVRSEGGNSGRARPRSSADLATPLIQLEESEQRVSETGTLPTLRESNEEQLQKKEVHSPEWSSYLRKGREHPTQVTPVFRTRT